MQRNRPFPAIILSGLLALLPLPAQAAPAAPAAGGETWLFAAAACPPWKDVKGDPEQNARLNGACEKDIDLILSGMRAAFDLPDSRVVTLLNEQATGAGVSGAITALAARVKPEDRVIFYINIHGGRIEGLYKGYEVKDEVFAWYTEERPASSEAATASGAWMTARAFRDLINQVMAREIVTIIEACYADAALSDYIDNVHDGIGGRGEDWDGREAVIFSSYEEQVANFTPDETEALFTKIFSQTLAEPDNRTLFDAFEEARVETHRAVRENCARDHTLKELVQGWQSYRELCTQMPNAWDPFGLLDDITLMRANYGTQSSF